MEIILSKQAHKTIRAMDAATRRRVRLGIQQLPQGSVKPLRGAPGHYRLRVGDWRILFLYEGQDTVRITKITPRGDAYKGV
ncbi:MAG: type II toxin-antitoxin system RelE/ParE family toxin [Oscillospiraceae bacterium]|nr:type II toxin-antitoxin system RelE/ParE family toxin [Oscillospiraceae bacterium]